MIHLDYAKKHILNKAYDNLKNTLIAEKKNKKNSIILTFLEVKSNDRYRLLHDSMIEDSSILPTNDFKFLLDNNLIIESEEKKKYYISAKGIWHIEKEKNIANEDNLIDYINDKYFVFSHISKKLTDKEKIILLTFIGLRAFSEDSSIHLKGNKKSKDIIQDAIEKSHSILKELNQISLSKTHIFGKIGNEHPISNLIRHTDALPKKTKGIYKAAGDQHYFLNISENNELSTSSLSYVFSLIFSKNNIKYTDIHQINDFLKNITYEKSIYVFDIDKHIFSSPLYDDVILDSLKEIVY